MPEPTKTGGSTWTGEAVLTGTVFLAWTSPAATGQNGGALTVAPRTTGIWTQSHWTSKLTYLQGQASTSCAQSVRAIPRVRLGWTGSADPTATCQGQRIEPVGSAGYTTRQGSGPNAGIWYVSNATYFFKSASQLHPGVQPTGPAYTLTSTTQANLCRTNGGFPAGPVSVNFWTYNSQCDPVSGWSGFINAMWQHEQGHFDQAKNALLAPGNNLYLELEGIVQPSQFEAVGEVADAYENVQSAATTAGTPHPTGNWTTPFWLWTSDAINTFSFAANPNFSVGPAAGAGRSGGRP